MYFQQARHFLVGANVSYRHPYSTLSASYTEANNYRQGGLGARGTVVLTLRQKDYMQYLYNYLNNLTDTRDYSHPYSNSFDVSLKEKQHHASRL